MVFFCASDHSEHLWRKEGELQHGPRRLASRAPLFIAPSGSFALVLRFPVWEDCIKRKEKASNTFATSLPMGFSPGKPPLIILTTISAAIAGPRSR